MPESNSMPREKKRNELEKVATRTLLKNYRLLSDLCKVLDHGNLWSNANHIRLAIDLELGRRDRARSNV